MKTSLEERFRKKLLKFGKKNRFCRICVFPVLLLGMLFFHGVTYCRKNGKRFAMISMTFLLFAVYTSFSFPIFIMGDDSADVTMQVSEEAKDITLATETEINLEDIELLDDDDVRLEDDAFRETAHGVDIVAKYSASEILDYTKTEAEKNTHETVNEGQENKEPQDGVTEVGDETETDAANGDAEADAPVFSKDDWRLVLINKQHSIPDDYEVTLGSINTIKGSMKCDERIIDELLLMLQAAKEDGITLAICSPYRDYEYQTMLFERKIKRYMGMGMSYMEAYQLSNQYVTVPGASEHQLGLALDIVTDTYMTLDAGFGETDAGIWLAENCHKYGFILRYPLGKEYITGIEYEPWHFRYVGVEAATVIMEAGITLEEFWEDL